MATEDHVQQFKVKLKLSPLCVDQLSISCLIRQRRLGLLLAVSSHVQTSKQN